MSQLSKNYDFGTLEPYWYDQWLQKNAFSPVVVEANKDPYVIVIPPPNVTGILHMGHLLNNTLQDIMVRRARLEGRSALWIPGTDHAGLATQMKVEQALRKEGVDPKGLSREQLMEKILAWCEKHGGTILNQLKRMGCSCDWNRTAYTMNKEYHDAVLDAFVRLYNKGYIYRGYRMVNWCPVTQTGISDEEVEMREEEGIFAKIKYELVEHPGEYIEIETTRPETLMGDTAVAVNPAHPKYAKYIGCKVRRPFPAAEIPVIADEAADPEFGTGALKVTPAHDRTDFEIGQRHNLEIIDIFNPDATLNEKAGERYNGMTRDEARKESLKQLEEMGLLVNVKPYVHNVGYSDRGGVPIEPRLSIQWWMKYPQIEEAKRAVSENHINFYPKRWEKVYLNWLNNIQDWCISRQVIWGQRIPVWYRKDADRNDPANYHVSVAGPEDPENWEQETDVLDTWASSWLWPLATMGWPDKEAMAKSGFADFYPTTTLCTAPDIIFFWVARMIIAGLEFGEGDFLQRLPFKNVYFTGIVRDAKGRKMSKSLGNSPDPMDLFAKYGADGTRFGLIRNAPTGGDIPFDEEMVELGRNFCTKLWNAARFREMQGEFRQGATFESIVAEIEADKMDAYDHWILQRLVELTSDVQKGFENFEFMTIANALYSFFWNDYCDWYVEAAKARLTDEAQKQHILAIQDIVLRQFLQLLNPIAPHVTEELWTKMGFATDGAALIHQSEIKSADDLTQAFAGLSLSADSSKFVGHLTELVAAARNLKAERGMSSRRDSVFAIKTTQTDELASQKDVLMRFMGAAEINLVSDDVENAPAVVTPLGTLYLNLSDSISDEDKARLAKQLQQLEGAIASAQSKLGNPGFTDKAPAHVVDAVRQTMEQNVAKADEIRRLIGAVAAK